MLGFGMNALTFAAGFASVAAAGMTYVVGRRVHLEFSNGRLAAALVVFLMVATLEYWVLGPFSFMDFNLESGAVSYDSFLARHGDGIFSDRLAGGQDLDIYFVGTQYLHPEAWLLAVFPVWLALLVHKLAVGALAFMGVWLLMSRVAPHAFLPNIAVAAAVAVSHDYLTVLSTEFGTGFAALPLATYLCVVRSGERVYWRFALAAVFLVALGWPIKVFPALGVAFVAAVILFRPVDMLRVTGVFVLMIAASVLNWHEVLFAMVSNAPYVVRGFGTEENGASSLSSAMGGTLTAALSYWFPTLLAGLGLAGLAVRRSYQFLRGASALAWVFAAIVFADAFPWHTVGLEPLNRLSHQQYMIMSMVVVAPVLMAHALKSPPSRRVSAALLAIPLGMLAWQKTVNIATLAAVGGQSGLKWVDAVATPDWSPQPDFRTVTFYEYPSANVIAGFYGFDTFDGQPNLHSRPWTRYWLAALHGRRDHGLVTRLGWNWAFWDEKNGSYEADSHVRLDLLAAANVRYVFSPLPLSSSRLRLLHAAKYEDWARGRPDMFGGLVGYARQRIARVFDGGDVFVYEIEGALPRVWAARGLIAAEEGTPASYYLVASAAASRTLVVRPEDVGTLAADEDMRVLEYRSAKGGYDVTVDAPRGGVLVVSVTHWPWWRARIEGGVEVPVVPAGNGVQVAIAVPQGTRTVALRYERPSLKSRLADLLGGGL